MVSAVASNPYYSYLNQLEGASASSASTPATSTTGLASTAITPPATSTSSSADTTASSLASSLLSGGSFSPEALTLLQQNSSGSFDPITSLLGGTGTNDGNTTLEADLLDSVAASALTQAQDSNATQAATTASGTGSSSTGSTGSTTGSTATTQTTDFVLSLINAQTQASVAYNQTIQQNAQNIISANSYGPDGSPLVA